MANFPTKSDVWIAGFREQYPDFDYTWINFRTMFEMLQTGINKAGSVDPLQIALALEGLEITDALQWLMVQVALPESPPENVNEYLKARLYEALDEAERWALKKNRAAGLPSLRAIASKL